MNLSIVILFTDKDWQDAYRYYNNFRPNGYYEYIFIDNCKESNNAFTNKKDVTCIFANNIAIAAARKLALQFCNGNYVWYVDADDEALNMDRLSKMSFDSDCITFRYTAIEQIYGQKVQSTPLKQNVFDGGGLWNKLIKKSVLVDIYNKLPELKYQTFEDTIVNQLVKLLGYSIEYRDLIIYNYNQYKSHAGSDPVKYFTNIKEVFNQTYDIEVDPEISRKLRKKLFDQMWIGATYHVKNYYNGDFSKFDIIHTVIDRQTIVKMQSFLELRNWLLNNGEFSLLENEYGIRD